MIRDRDGNEDLMKEAVSLVKRIECRSQSRPELAVLGLNELGWLSVYLGNDPMYRFDEQGRLRRAFVDGMLLRTDGHTLAMMERTRNLPTDETDGNRKTILLRRDLTPEQLRAFRERMHTELEEVCEVLTHGEITRQHPTEMTGLVQEFLQAAILVLQSREFLAPPIVRR